MIAPPTQPAYHLHIALRHFEPAICRDVLVSPAITLPGLHRLIQAAMGWEDAQMHGFALPLDNESYWKVPNDRRFGKPSTDTCGEPAQNENHFKLNDLLREPQEKLLYMYDFGDDWEHVITLKAVSETDTPLPHLLKAHNGYCGGPAGAEYWASIWYDKTHPEHGIALDTFGEHEPGWLDFKALQKAVQKLQPRTQPQFNAV